MQQPQLITYADIAEVRAVTGAATCNQLLAEGWVLLGVYLLMMVADMEQQPETGERKQDIQRYVKRFVGYVLGRRREQVGLKNGYFETGAQVLAQGRKEPSR